MGEWLKSTFEQHPHDFDYLVWAVTGHHRKELDEATHDSFGMKLLTKDPDFQKCIEWIADACRLPKPNFVLATLENMPWNVGASRRYGRTEETLGDVLGKPGKILKGSLEKCVYACDDVVVDDEERRLMAAARSMLMVADVVASAAAGKISVSSKESNGDGWTDGLNSTNPDNVDVLQHVLERMIEWIIGIIDSNHTDAKNLDAKDKREVGTLKDLPDAAFFNDVVERKRGEINATAASQANAKMSQQRQKFQEEVAHSQSRVTLVSAGCGSGKTLAAYLWAAEQCPDTGARLCFCYPTTGTATEGYMDYLVGDENVWGELIHSRSDADYQIFERLQQVRQDNEEPELLSVMRSLHFWTGKIICCTVDTVLGFLVNTYSGHLAWPALAQSMFVFDEIHSFDEQLFGWLLEFLKTMRGSKILLMTASLPKHRRQAIEKVLEKQDEMLGMVYGPAEWEKIERYRRYTPVDSAVNTSATALAKSAGTLCTPELAVQEAIASYQKGEKVLYICNTVDRAIGMALQIHEQMKWMKLIGDDVLPSANPALIVYHSHFKYEDRVKRHEAIIKAFRRSGGVICVTTQVAEMSLDISADFLISELAPIPAMIQRLGRLNRRALTDSPRSFMVVVPTDSDGNLQLLPYSKNTEPSVWFDAAREWLESLGDAPLSQADLVNHWESLTKKKEHDGGIPLQKRRMALWLAKGLDHAMHTNLRNVDHGCDVIFESDLEQLEKFCETKDDRKKYFRLVVMPMSMPRAELGMKRHSRYDCFIVENGVDIDYDEFGGRWRSRTSDSMNEKTPSSPKKEGKTQTLNIGVITATRDLNSCRISKRRD